MDAGTAPKPEGILNFFKALEANRKVGGVAGFLGVRYDIKCCEGRICENIDFDLQGWPNTSGQATGIPEELTKE